MSKGIPSIRVRVGPDRASDTATTSRAAVVGEMAAKTPLYQTDPSFKAAVDDYAAAGDALVEADVDVAAAKALLAKARSVREAKRAACRQAQGVCVAQIQQHATTPADATACGFLLFDPVQRGLMLPREISLKYDAEKRFVRVHVKYTSGKHKVALELSPDPVTDTSWVRIDATGMRQTFKDLAPGTWWFRAATLGASSRSDWFGPVAVIVR
jgi:hypothetical protein